MSELSAAHYAEGVGGRLSTAKSDGYRRATGLVEGRANRYLARYMLASDLAYVLTAWELGLTPEAAARPLVETLIEALRRDQPIGDGEPTADIVVQRETWLIERLGPEVGGWVHLGRNRGESLRSFLPRMFFRHSFHGQRRALLALLEALVRRAEPALETLAPNYHHLGHSGYSTLGEYLLFWAAALLTHLERLEQVDRRLDHAPPVLTSREPVKLLADRVSQRLGFSRRAQLRREVMWDEDQFSEPLFILTLISVDLGRLAEDLSLWMTAEFDLFDLSDRHASGSSAHPQKKNPFGLQTVIGGASIGIGRLAGQLSASLTHSGRSDGYYHAGSLYQYAEDVIAWTEYLAEVVSDGSFDVDELARKARLGGAGAPEAIDLLVFDYGVPFRAAHRALGALVRALETGVPPPDLRAMLEAETGRAVPIDQAQLEAIVRGEIIPPTALDLPMIRGRWGELSDAVQDADRTTPAVSPVDAAIMALVGEANARLDSAPAR